MNARLIEKGCRPEILEGIRYGQFIGNMETVTRSNSAQINRMIKRCSNEKGTGAGRLLFGRAGKGRRRLDLFCRKAIQTMMKWTCEDTERIQNVSGRQTSRRKAPHGRAFSGCQNCSVVVIFPDVASMSHHFSCRSVAQIPPHSSLSFCHGSECHV